MVNRVDGFVRDGVYAPEIPYYIYGNGISTLFLGFIFRRVGLNNQRGRLRIVFPLERYTHSPVQNPKSVCVLAYRVDGFMHDGVCAPENPCYAY